MCSFLCSFRFSLLILLPLRCGCLCLLSADRAEEVLNEAISDTLYTRIMREFAVFSKGLWVLKEEGFTGVDDAAMTAKAEQ